MRGKLLSREEIEGNLLSFGLKRLGEPNKVITVDDARDLVRASLDALLEQARAEGEREGQKGAFREEDECRQYGRKEQ